LPCHMGRPSDTYHLSTTYPLRGGPQSVLRGSLPHPSWTIGAAGHPGESTGGRGGSLCPLPAGQPRGAPHPRLRAPVGSSARRSRGYPRPHWPDRPGNPRISQGRKRGWDREILPPPDHSADSSSITPV
jgi:hypothetical protein